MHDAAGVTIAKIALYQGVKRPLMSAGEDSTSTVPIIAGKQALLRVFVKVDASYDGEPVTARLYIGESDQPIEVVGKLVNSTEAALDSTVNFDIAGKLLDNATKYRVELLQSGEGDENTSARYPKTGFAAISVTQGADTLKIKVVPVAYGADGSNRLPVVSDTQLNRLRDAFLAMYPVAKVVISLRAKIAWNQSVSANGSGWETLLDKVQSVRAADKAPADVYYLGLVRPKETLTAFCGSACMAGLGFLAPATDASSRVAVGIGYADDLTRETALHEIGHAHGRLHAPCA